MRDLEVEAVLEPGTYIIVPRTTGCRYPKPSNKKSPMPFKDELLIETGQGPNMLTTKVETICE